VGERYVSAIAIEDLAPGGMKVVQVEGREIVVGNDGGRFYAVERRCGHMNAPLEMGTLVGTVLTCPMHCAQFDIATGEALAGPVPTTQATSPLLQDWASARKRRHADGAHPNAGYPHLCNEGGFGEGLDCPVGPACTTSEWR